MWSTLSGWTHVWQLVLSPLMLTYATVLARNQGLRDAENRNPEPPMYILNGMGKEELMDCTAQTNATALVAQGSFNVLVHAGLGSRQLTGDRAEQIPRVSEVTLLQQLLSP